jgi:hypothetical protein
MKSAAKLQFVAILLVGLACALSPNALARDWRSGGQHEQHARSVASHVSRGERSRESSPRYSHSIRSSGSHFEYARPHRTRRASSRSFYNDSTRRVRERSVQRMVTADRPSRGLRASRMDRTSFRDMRGARSAARRRIPPHGFRGVPNNYRGGRGLAAGGNSARAGRTFHGHGYNQMSSQERRSWAHGTWRHARHDGRFGWWWYVDGFWFFYSEPIYPFPTYIGYDYDDEYAPDYYWYWCDDPPGYYPYVQECYDEWVPVAPTPY